MYSSSTVPLLLPMVVSDLPRMLVCLVACVLILTRWNELGSAALPGVLGFALALVLSVAGPLVSVLLPTLLPGPPSANAMTFTIVRVVLGLGWALALGLVAWAVMAGRSPRGPGRP